MRTSVEMVTSTTVKTVSMRKSEEAVTWHEHDSQMRSRTNLILTNQKNGWESLEFSSVSIDTKIWT